jgi:hypothetical protein
MGQTTTQINMLFSCTTGSSSSSSHFSSSLPTTVFHLFGKGTWLEPAAAALTHVTRRKRESRHASCSERGGVLHASVLTCAGNKAATTSH